jgi:hypothetical protein
MSGGNRKNRVMFKGGRPGEKRTLSTRAGRGQQRGEGNTMYRSIKPIFFSQNL